MWNEDYAMINHPINVVKNPVDDVEVQIQEAAGEGNGILEFENTIPENNLPKGTSTPAARNNWELNTFSPIQEPMIPDFAYVKSNITMPEIYGTLAEMFNMGYTMLEKSQTQHQPKPQ
ncbi:hypothetical protein H5410_033113 [Solanum commersonii]|uniref:Uncharacterized protein n=1 Tax=Solanum commersonii TaxID=4109 RepID=A0A9J5YPT0_SOLCO|nr:hypothetical protein H5410_033113 [Solanum commersonii]